ncbi:MAG: FAD-binding protein [Sandaracinaceae bacterium]|nr:FAD-binding protein [Sandaracinaceae bacterium]
MYAYLALEAEDAVSEETLRAFCERSVETFEWLCAMGVPFPPSGEALKTSYPPDHCTLYFSGNELCPPYCDAARPPRAGTARSARLTGHLIFGGLERTAVAAGITLRTRTRAERLVVDEGGEVLGVELAELAAPLAPLQELGKLLVTYGGGFSIPATEVLSRRLARFEDRVVRKRLVRAKGGVVLAAGGFVFNPAMMREHAELRELEHAPRHRGRRRARHPPRSRGGRRHRAHGSLLRVALHQPAERLDARHPGRDGRRAPLQRGALRLEDRRAHRRARRPRRPDHRRCHDGARARADAHRAHGRLPARLRRRQQLPQPRQGRLARRSGRRLRPAARAPPRQRRGVQRGRAREEGRDGQERGRAPPHREGPFFAIDCDLDTVAFPTPCITLGGLVVDGLRARVVREDGGEPIAGLYAAGRNAVGVSSHSYVSGLSVSDGIFSGRNAGAAAAARALHEEAPRASFASVRA